MAIFGSVKQQSMIRKILIGVWVCLVMGVAYVGAEELRSPDGKLSLRFALAADGRPTYTLSREGRTVIEPSGLGIAVYPDERLCADFEVLALRRAERDTTWRTVWGQEAEIRDHHRELLVELRHRPSQWRINIRFRLANDGLGFRYEFPVQGAVRHFILTDELTEFALGRDAKAFWLPADYDTNEFPTTTSRLSKVRGLIDSVRREPLAAKAPAPVLAVQTPLMLVADGMYISIHEAALVDYAAMHLELDDRGMVLRSHLAPDLRGFRGFLQTGSVTPWRTIVASTDARDILASRLILNLNEPSRIVDTSWIRPMKYIGIWWEYFTGRGSTWAYSANQDIRIGETDYRTLKPNGTHGATTEHTKAYIDFAARHGFDAVLVEGWNEGWEDNWAYGKERIYSFTRAYPDYDVAELQRYAEAHGIKLIMHHETTSSVADYERQLHDAFAFMKQYGYPAVKTGYVGRIIPRSEYHDGQWMVGHYLHVLETAARHRIMVNAHEAVRPTGLHRTWPNLLAQESARGTEFESFNGNTPDHTTILPFTRLMGGPMDYTPGILEGDLSVYGPNKAKRSTTLAKQLALYVTMYSSLQMAADLKESYERYTDAFQFIKDVPVDWEHTYILEAEPGDYISIARQKRGAHEWYIGAITDEAARTAKLDLSFLPRGRYEATIYADGKTAHWQTNPQSYRIWREQVTERTKLSIPLAPSGGVAIRIVPR